MNISKHTDWLNRIPSTLLDLLNAFICLAVGVLLVNSANLFESTKLYDTFRIFNDSELFWGSIFSSVGLFGIGILFTTLINRALLLFINRLLQLYTFSLLFFIDIRSPILPLSTYVYFVLAVFCLINLLESNYLKRC